MQGSLARARARFALERIDNWASAPSFNFKDFVACLQGLPVEIRMQGLTPVIARLADKKEGSPEERAARVLAEWLLNGAPQRPLGSAVKPGGRGPVNDLLTQTVHVALAEYGAAQVEAIEMAEVVKRLARARAAQMPEETP